MVLQHSLLAYARLSFDNTGDKGDTPYLRMMAKKSRRRILDQELKLYRIHCECVRRNPEYKKYYEEWQGMTNAPDVERVLAQQDLVNRWGVLPGDFPDPKKRPSLKKALTKAVHSRYEVSRYLGWRNSDPRVQYAHNAFRTTVVHREVEAQQVAGMLLLLYFPEENCEQPYYDAINMRWSKKDLMEAWGHFVDCCIRDRKKAGLKQEAPQQRLRLEEYELYLKAYDLRKMKHTYKEIDLQIFSQLGGDEKRGFTYYRKGEALVANPPLLPQRGKRKRVTA